MHNNSSNNNTNNNVGVFENSSDVNNEVSALVFLSRNEACLKARQEQNVRRQRSRSFSEPGDRRRNLESDFFYAAHLDLDRQTLLEREKKVDISDKTSNDEENDDNDDLDERDVEEEETSF